MPGTECQASVMAKHPCRTGDHRGSQIFFSSTPVKSREMQPLYDLTPSPTLLHKMPPFISFSQLLSSLPTPILTQHPCFCLQCPSHMTVHPEQVLRCLRGMGTLPLQARPRKQAATLIKNNHTQYTACRRSILSTLRSDILELGRISRT